MSGRTETARSNLLVAVMLASCIGFAVGVYILAGFGLKELLAR